MKAYLKPAKAKDLSTNGRIVLAEGESTGHSHEIFAAEESEAAIPAAEFFEEPSGRRVLMVTRPCVLRHQEHGPIALDPSAPQQYRQGDVLLSPIGLGAWEVLRQREYHPEAIRQVQD
jgi:hypothetical protein